MSFVTILRQYTQKIDHLELEKKFKLFLDPTIYTFSDFPNFCDISSIINEITKKYHFSYHFKKLA